MLLFPGDHTLGKASSLNEGERAHKARTAVRGAFPWKHTCTVPPQSASRHCLDWAAPAVPPAARPSCAARPGMPPADQTTQGGRVAHEAWWWQGGGKRVARPVVVARGVIALLEAATAQGYTRRGLVAAAVPLGPSLQYLAPSPTVLRAAFQPHPETPVSHWSTPPSCVTARCPLACRPTPHPHTHHITARPTISSQQVVAQGGCVTPQATYTVGW